jgi:RimJ/RimL family protein N-acetyltransferase
MRGMTESGDAVTLSQVGLSDVELLYAWRTNPLIYEHLLQQDEPVEWSEHLAWFHSRPDRRYDFLIEYDGRSVGATSVNDDDFVTIYIADPNLRGQGIGKAAIELLCSTFEDRQLQTMIHEDNEAAQQLFVSCGFQLVETSGNRLRYCQR